MQPREHARDPAVRLLGPWRIEIPRAQAGLDMADRHAAVVAREACGERGRGVAVDEDHVGPGRLEDGLQAAQDERGHLREILAGPHHVEVEVGRDPEERQHLVEHLAMLGGHADARREARVGPQGEHDRRHLDRLGPRPENAQNPERHAACRPPMQRRL